MVVVLLVGCVLIVGGCIETGLICDVLLFDLSIGCVICVGVLS